MNHVVHAATRARFNLAAMTRGMLYALFAFSSLFFYLTATPANAAQTITQTSKLSSAQTGADQVVRAVAGRYSIVAWSNTKESAPHSGVLVTDSSGKTIRTIWQSRDEPYFSPQILTAADWLFHGQQVFVIVRQAGAGFSVAEPIAIVSGRVVQLPSFSAEQLSQVIVGASVFETTELYSRSVQSDRLNAPPTAYWFDGQRFVSTEITTDANSRSVLERAIGNAQLFVPSLGETVAFKNGESQNRTSVSHVHLLSVSAQAPTGRDSPDVLVEITTKFAAVEYHDVAALFVTHGEIKFAAGYALGDMVAVKRSQAHLDLFELDYQAIGPEDKAFAPTSERHVALEYNGSKALTVR